MPWLAELVESNEGSLDVLPVQCLCEFLLHEAQDLPRDGVDDESAKFEKHKKRQVGMVEEFYLPLYRAPDKSAYWKTIFFISHPKHMLWVLKRNVSMRRFF